MNSGRKQPVAQENTIIEDVFELNEPETAKDGIFWACRTALLAGAYLVRNGYGKMMIFPYISGMGTWRCEFHSPGRQSNAFYRYTSASYFHYLADHCGGSVRRNIGPKKLAEAIMVSVPSWEKEQCAGEASAESLRWLEMVSRYLDSYYIPSACNEYTEDYSHWELVSLHNTQKLLLPPQPGYSKPGSDRHWSDEPFWRKYVEHCETMRQEPIFAINWEMCEDNPEFDQLAKMAASTLRNVGESEAPHILRTTIAALHHMFERALNEGQ